MVKVDQQLSIDENKLRHIAISTCAMPPRSHFGTGTDLDVLINSAGLE